MVKFEIVKRSSKRAIDYLLEQCGALSEEDQEANIELVNILTNLDNSIQSVDTIEKKVALLVEIQEKMPVIREKVEDIGLINSGFAVFLLALLQMSESMSDEDLKTEIGLSDWVVKPVSILSYENVAYTNPDDLEHEMMIVSTRNVGVFFQNPALVNLIFRFIYRYEVNCTSELLMVYNRKCEVEKCLSFLKMIEVYKGNSHTYSVPYHYSSPSMSLRFDSSLDYRQNEELIEVMDEYNCHESLIDRYLRIYQAIEYYTYKVRICFLCDSARYRKLSVRNFLYLSETLSTSEKEAIKEFLKNIYPLNLDTHDIGTHIFNMWDTKINAVSANHSHLNRTLDLLSIRKTKSGADRPIVFRSRELLDMNALITDLIYQIRCSIVHDKVNEYHITYTNLNEDIIWVIGELLLPIMEKIVYGLMFNNNTVSVYKQQALNLY